MEDERKIISVDRIGQDTILIYLSDGTMVEVTSEQLLSFGLPRYPVADGWGELPSCHPKSSGSSSQELTSASVFLSTAVACR